MTIIRDQHLLPARPAPPLPVQANTAPPYNSCWLDSQSLKSPCGKLGYQRQVATIWRARGKILIINICLSSRTSERAKELL